MVAVLASASASAAHPNRAPDRGHPATTDGLSVTFHLHRARVLLRSAYSLERWEAGPKRSAVKDAQRHKRAIRVAATRRQISAYRDKLSERLRDYAAEQREIARLTPFDCGSYGSFAVPCAIVSCESHYIATARNTSSSAGGYYQVLDTTWYAYGGSHNGDSHPAAAAPPQEQHQVASRLYAAEGTSPWAASEHCWGS